jgi:hypothetical protein
MEFFNQGWLSRKLVEKRVANWREAASPPDRVRLSAYAAKAAGRILTLTPSETLDTNLKKGEFLAAAGARLGVDVMEGGLMCAFCGMLLDAKGLHAWSCTAGGDHTLRHNAVREVYMDYCSRGSLRPEREAPELLREVLGKDDQHRPADVLCMPSLTLARKLPDGSVSVRTERVCLDFAVINALGQSHWAETAREGGSAADKYCRTKSARNDTEQKCTQAGLRFVPVVHEVQGGMSKTAHVVMRSIAEAVAEQEARDPLAIRREMEGRIAVVVARAAAAAVSRRCRPRPRRLGDFLVREQLAQLALQTAVEDG